MKEQLVHGDKEYGSMNTTMHINTRQPYGQENLNTFETWRE